MSTAEVHPGIEALDANAIRRDFPILATEMRGKPLVFLDTAASAPNSTWFFSSAVVSTRKPRQSPTLV